MLLFKKSRLVLLLFLFVEFLFSQQYPSKNYSTLDGLPNNSVYSILKDSRGILWAGTANGLSAIKNGKIIQNFYTSDGLAHNSCWAIAEDRNNNLWFGSHGGGLTFYDGVKFKIINEKTGLINNSIRKLFIDKKFLYVGTEFGISVIDIDKKKVVFNKKIIGQRKKFQVMDFVKINSKIYFGTFNDGLWNIDVSSKSIKLINHNKPDIYSIHKTNNNFLICNGETQFDKSINLFKTKEITKNVTPQESFGSTIFWDFITDKSGITYGAGNGINFSTGGVFRVENNKTVNVNELFNIDSFEIWSLHYEAQNDILFVSTTNKGFYEIDLKREINFYSATFFNKPKLEIISIQNSKTNKLILHKNGLSFINQNKIIKEVNNKEFYDFSRFFFKSEKNYSEFNGYYYTFRNAKLDAFEFKELSVIKNEIWINTTIGLFKVTNDGNITEYYPLFISSFNFIDSNTLLFQQSYSDVIIINNLKGKPTYKNYDITETNNPKDVIKIIPLNNKFYLISSSQGLFRLENNKFYSYFSNDVWLEKELVDATINNKNELVIANSIGDVFLINESSKFKMSKKIDHNKIIGNSISFLQCYKDYILIGTEKGINIYKDGIIRLIDEEQGLKSKIFTSANLNGAILTIGTQNGFYEFDLKKYLSAKKQSVNAEISNLEVNFKPLRKNVLRWFNYKYSTIKLPYNENTISINFEPKQATYPNKLEFRYKLLGIENSNWSKWTREKNINLTYLPNGNYVVKLELKDFNSGLISSCDILKITIIPPFWKTWWFIISNILFFSILGFIIYKKRIHLVENRERAKATIQKRLAETKMEALQSQMNPHFIFNAMNSIQNYIIDNNVDDALMYMGEFSKLIRQTLNNSSQQRITLKDEIRYLKSYITLENMRFKNKINFILNIDANLDLVEIEIPPMLIQPFIENVFVHAFDSNSKDPTLLISMRQIGNYLLCEIKDNGKGMASENLNKLNTSKGIQLAKERIALFQSETTDAVAISSSATGTTVVLKLKIQ